MTEPFTLDGNALIGSYEHVRRSIEFAGLPFAGWLELTGGGFQREGQNYVYGAGDEPRGVTDGRVTPQDITCKMEIGTFELLKAALTAAAIANGDTSATNYTKVPWQVVDQYRGADLTQKTLTITSTVKMNAVKPDTPNDGNQFYKELTLKQVGVAKEQYA